MMTFSTVTYRFLELRRVLQSRFPQNIIESNITQLARAVSRVRMGKQQEIETLINEEAMLFAQYLRNELQSWKPRIVLEPF
jgi:hypothetical protein